MQLRGVSKTLRLGGVGAAPDSKVSGAARSSNSSVPWITVWPPRYGSKTCQSPPVDPVAENIPHLRVEHVCEWASTPGRASLPQSPQCLLLVGAAVCSSGESAAIEASCHETCATARGARGRMHLAATAANQ